MLGFPIGVIPALVTLSVSHIPPGCPSAAVWYLWVHPSVFPPYADACNHTGCSGTRSRLQRAADAPYV